MISIQASTKLRGKSRWRSVEAAKRRVKDDETYLISRHGSWWRPDARGYTYELAEAGLYDGATARGYLAVEGLSVVPLKSLRKRLIAELDEASSRISLLRLKLERLAAVPKGGPA